MDEDLNKNLNENNNLEEPETKEPIDETLESVTADKTRDVEGTNLGNNHKGTMESGVLDRNAVLNEFDKLMMSPEYKQYRNLISGLEMDETSLLTKICTPKLLSTYEPGQESLAAREVFAMMSYMGAREAAVKRITSSKFDKIDLTSDNVVGIPKDIIEQKGMEEEVDAAVTDPDYNREVLGSTNVLFSIKNNMIQALDLTDIAALEGIKRMLQKMEEDINKAMKTMSKPRTTIPEAEAKRLKELFDEAIKAKNEASHSKIENNSFDEKNAMQTGESTDYKDLTTEDILAQNKQGMIDRESLNKSSVLNGIVEDTIEGAKFDKASANRVGMGIADVVGRDATKTREEINRLNQREADEKYEQEQKDRNQQNDRYEKGEK